MNVTLRITGQGACLMHATLTYGQGSRPEFDADHPLDYFLRKLGFDGGIHFLKCFFKCLLLAILESG